MNQSAERLRTSLELAERAVLSYSDDADLDSAVEGRLFRSSRNAGQTCVFANRLYVNLPSTLPLLKNWSPPFKKLKVGNGLEREFFRTSY